MNARLAYCLKPVLWFVMVWALLAGPASALAAASAVVLNPDRGEWPLGHHLDLLEDPDGRLTIDQVRSAELAARFETSQLAVPNFSFTDSVYWVRLRVENASNRDAEWLLELGFSNMHRLSLYRPSADGDGYQEMRTGVLEPFDSRELPVARFMFQVPLTAGEKQTLFLRFENGAAMTLPLTLWTPGEWQRHHATGLLIAGLFYGALLVVLGHSLLLGLVLRDRGFLWFALFVLSFVLAQLSFDGIGSRYLWPQATWIALYTVPLFTLLALITVLRLTHIALDTRHQTPRLHRVMVLWQGLGLLLIMQIPLFDYGVVMRQAGVLIVVSFLTLPWVAIVAWRGGYRPARWFTLAWSVLMLSVLAHYFARLGFAPSNILTENGYQAGMVILVVLVSLGLAERIRELERGRQHALLALAGVQRASTLGEMAASIAHELNQPLAAISANSGALRRWLTGDGETADVAGRVVPILEQLSADSLRAGDTLHRLRALFERGQAMVAPVDGNVIVHEVVAMLRLGERYHLTRLAEQPGTGLPMVSADAVQIQQVLMNLIANAADAGATEISVRTSLRSSNEVLVTVGDNGGGIDPKLGERVFEPFFSTRSDGMGMGLAICATIVRGHRGRLWWQPGEAGGSCFLFTLPVADAQAAPDPQGVPDRTVKPPRSCS